MYLKQVEMRQKKCAQRGREQKLHHNQVKVSFQPTLMSLQFESVAMLPQGPSVQHKSNCVLKNLSSIR